MNRQTLYRKIDLYFEAELTRQEEQSLLKELLKHEGQDPIADEALAVMLASRLPLPSRARKKKPIRRAMAVAASVAALLALGFLLHQHATNRDSDMFAYVGGVKVDDPQEIMNIIDTQLSDIGASSELFAQTVSDDLDDIRDALISDDI